ncbi:MAG: hypothetical protein KatS3mg110_3704 [Pirellulaceae bacterium]|nr:MAG: hypothetical protein KatS3mg110_3704 [Pirellulaceae bacterium]
MAKSRTFRNPFYVLVMLAGIVFVLSACAYGTMLVRVSRMAYEEQPQLQPAWIVWLERQGTWLLVAELVVLGILTVAAIGTDDYWEQRAARRENRQTSEIGDRTS